VSKAASTINVDQAAINTRAKKTSVKAPPSIPSVIGRAYEGFLELPALVVLGMMWVAGVAMLGLCALVAYAVISTLAWNW
jgi:hypothetical protein